MPDAGSRMPVICFAGNWHPSEASIRHPF